jgi:putative membrane protein
MSTAAMLTVRPRKGQTGLMSERRSASWTSAGEEPDPRWTLANERTFLAYERTALGLLVAGLAMTGSRIIADAPLWLAATGIPFMAMGGAVGLEGRRRFVTAQAAMRAGTPLESPRVVAFLPLGIAAIAAIAAVAAMGQLLVSR